jgi:DNA primase catalytic subunit
MNLIKVSLDSLESKHSVKALNNETTEADKILIKLPTTNTNKRKAVDDINDSIKKSKPCKNDTIILDDTTDDIPKISEKTNLLNYLTKILHG